MNFGLEIILGWARGFTDQFPNLFKFKRILRAENKFWTKSGINVWLERMATSSLLHGGHSLLHFMFLTSWCEKNFNKSGFWDSEKNTISSTISNSASVSGFRCFHVRFWVIGHMGVWRHGSKSYANRRRIPSIWSTLDVQCDFAGHFGYYSI